MQSVLNFSDTKISSAQYAGIHSKWTAVALQPHLRWSWETEGSIIPQWAKLPGYILWSICGRDCMKNNSKINGLTRWSGTNILNLSELTQRWRIFLSYANIQQKVSNEKEELTQGQTYRPMGTNTELRNWSKPLCSINIRQRRLEHIMESRHTLQ